MSLVDDALPDQAQEYLDELESIRVEYSLTELSLNEDVEDFYENVEGVVENVQDELRCAYALREAADSNSDTPTNLAYLVDDFLTYEREIESADITYFEELDLSREALEEDLEEINEARRHAISVAESSSYGDRLESARQRQETIMLRNR